MGDLRNRVLKQRAPNNPFHSILDLPQSRIACHFAHLLSFHLKHFVKANDADDGAKASGAGAHHTHTRHKTTPNTKLGQGEARPSDLHNGGRMGSSGTSQRVPYHGQEAQSKGPVQAFEAAIFAFYRLNDGKVMITDDLLLEEGRSIRAARGISESDLRLSNGRLHKFKTRHGIQQHVLHNEADSVGRAQLAVNLMELKELIGQYSPRDVLNQLSSIAYLQTRHWHRSSATEISPRKIVSQSQCAAT